MRLPSLQEVASNQLFSYMEVGEVRSLYLKHSESAQVRFLKFETRKYYKTDEGLSLEAFRRGQITESMDLFRNDFQMTEPTDYKRTRYRVLDTPPTEYQQWQILAFPVLEETGEDILTIKRSDVPRQEATNLYDFILFDTDVLFVHDFLDDTLRGSWITEDHSLIQSYIGFLDAIRGKSVSISPSHN